MASVLLGLEGRIFLGKGNWKTRMVKGITSWMEELIFYSESEFCPRIRGDMISSVA